MNKNLKRLIISGLILGAMIATWTLLKSGMRQTPVAVISLETIQSETESYKQSVLEEHNKKINAMVSADLSNIESSRQLNLLLLSEAIMKYGSNSEQAKNLCGHKDVQDEMFRNKVCEIIDKYGWLGPDRIGAQNNYTLFTVMQNSDFATQEKYLPVMEKAVKSGSLQPEHYACLIDRKAMIQHRKQIFGTQVKLDLITGKNDIAPIIDEELVNERRRDIGLPPIGS